MSLFRTNPNVDTIVREIRTVAERLGEVEGKLAARSEELAMTEDVARLKKERDKLASSVDTLNEKHSRENREIEHKVGLHKKQVEHEISVAQKETELRVREENLSADAGAPVRVVSGRLGESVNSPRPGVRVIPTKVCLCGSTRFREAFEVANMDETLRGHIVVSVGMFGHADHPGGAQYLCSDGAAGSAVKQDLDQLHLRKIDLCDEVLVVNVADYIGTSTTREIAYATETGKLVRFMFPHEDKSYQYRSTDDLVTRVYVAALEQVTQ